MLHVLHMTKYIMNMWSGGEYMNHRTKTEEIATVQDFQTLPYQFLASSVLLNGHALLG